MHISDNGFTDTPATLPNGKLVKVCKDWIEDQILQKDFNLKMSSPMWKQEICVQTGTQVTNGAFLQAAKELGLKIQRDGANGFVNLKSPNKT